MERLICIAPRTRSTRGFTLIELMVTISVAGILLAIAVPSLRTFLQNNRLTSAANDVLRSFQIARSEAIKRQQHVIVCASANPTVATPACSSNGTFSGWIVFQDTNNNWAVDTGEPILERHEALDTSITVKTDNDGIESFASTGFADPPGAKNPTRNIVLCDIRGNKAADNVNSVERAVLIANTGRAHVSKTSIDVNNATVAAGACP